MCNMHENWKEGKIVHTKLDNLFKHIDRHKTKVSKLRITIGSFYFNIKN
jgi:hypothetical protein